MPSFLTRQPAKGIWTAMFILSLAVRLPWIALYNLPKAFRQHPTWTYRQALGTAILQLWFRYACSVRFQPSKSLEAGTEKERFVVIEPANPEQDLYRGIVKDSEIQPLAVGGTWFPSLYHRENDAVKKVILHFHGGAYVLGGARQFECGFGADVLIKATSAMVFCPQYRLASRPGGRFPAALQDALTSYKYLLDQGLFASQIIISGDSAGGNLCLALLRFLMDNKTLPLPAALFLWSPWVDLVNPQSIDHSENIAMDYVSSALAVWGTEAYVPSFMPLSHPYISPARNTFYTKVPIFIQAGGAEVLYKDIVNFSHAMKEIQGNRIELYDIPRAPHDIILVGHVLGWEEEAAAATRAAQRFLESLGL